MCILHYITIYKLGERKALWGSPELLSMPIVYARYAIALSIFLTVDCLLDAENLL